MLKLAHGVLPNFDSTFVQSNEDVKKNDGHSEC